MMGGKKFKTLYLHFWSMCMPPTPSF